MKRDKHRAAGRRWLRNGQLQAAPHEREMKDTGALEFEAIPVREKIGEMTYLFGELFPGFDCDLVPKIRSLMLTLSERVQRSVLRAAFDVAKGKCSLEWAGFETVWLVDVGPAG